MGNGKISPSVPLPGETLAGKYRIEKIIGMGGMGIVVSARHTTLDERVAIKFLHTKQDASTRERFLREARTAMRIRSEHVARVLDVGALEDGNPYTVFEFLEGEDLEAKSAAGPLPVQLAVDAIIQACDALAEAHAMGMVHRDLKPANLFVTERADGSPCVKVLDFGIAKIKGATTTASGLMGSPLYMAPEQFESASDVDARSDIWSLGATMYQLVTGVAPFEGQTIPLLYRSVMKSEPTPLTIAHPKETALDAVVRRCLAKRADDRYANVGELVRDLAPLASPDVAILSGRISRVLAGRKSTSLADSADVSKPLKVSAAHSNTERDFATTVHPKPSRGWKLGVAALAFIGLGAFGLAQIGSKHTPAAPLANPAPEPSTTIATTPPATIPTPTMPVAQVATPTPSHLSPVVIAPRTTASIVKSGASSAVLPPPTVSVVVASASASVDVDAGDAPRDIFRRH